MTSSLNVFIGLGTAVNGSGGIVEQTGSGYSRQATSFSYDPVANAGKTSGPVTFGPSSSGSWASAAFVGVYDAQTGGNLLFWWSIGAANVSTSKTFSLSAESLTFNAGVFSQSIGTGTVVGTKHGGAITTGAPIAYSATGNGLSANATVKIYASSQPTMSLSAPNVYDITLTQNTVFSLAATTSGTYQVVRLILRQGNTGGYTPALPSGVKWPNGVAPTPNSIVGNIDRYSFSTGDGGITWLGGS